MGYTHYWTQTKAFTIEEWGAVKQDIAVITALAGVPLANWEGAPGSFPTFDDNKVSFNGVGDDAHETFEITRKISEPSFPSARKGWSFCKTAHKPYDVVVTACLAYLASTGHFDVSSDGEAEDWTAGVNLAQRALPHRQIANPLEKNDVVQA